MCKRIVTFFVLFLVIGFVGCSQSNVQRVTVDKGELAKWENESVIKLLDSTCLQLNVDEDNNSLAEYCKEVYLVQKTESKELSGITIYYNKTIEDEPDIQITVIGYNGEYWRSSSSDITFFEASEETEYRTNLHYCYIEIPHYIKGTQIIKEVSRNYISPENLKYITIRNYLHIYKKYITFAFPKDAKIKYDLVNPEELPIEQSTGATIKQKTITITANKVPKISKYAKFQYPEEWLAGFYVSLPPKGSKSYSWEELGDYYLNEVRGNLNTNVDNIKKAADQIKGSTREELLSNAFNYVVTNIRYHADERGIYSWVARAPSTILAQGYGDCKEMSTLLKVLLQLKGIESNLTITSTKGFSQIIDDIPTFGGFNHMILAVENADGTIQYLDPTIDYANSKNSHYPLLNRKVVILESGKSRVEKVKKNRDYKNSILTKNKIEKDGERWRISGTIELFGKAAFVFYPINISVNRDEKEDYINSYLNSAFEMNVTSAKIEKSTSEYAKISYSADFTSNYLDLDNGGFKLNIPYIYGGKGGYTTIKPEGNFYFENETQTDYWELPDGFKIDKPLNVEGDIFSGTWEMKGNSVIRRTSNISKMLKRSDKNAVSGYRKSINSLSSATIWKG